LAWLGCEHSFNALVKYRAHQDNKKEETTPNWFIIMPIKACYWSPTDIVMSNWHNDILADLFPFDPYFSSIVSLTSRVTESLPVFG
jgi:hypothetical protein